MVYDDFILPKSVSILTDNTRNASLETFLS